MSNKDLIAQMRERLNARAGKEVAKTFTVEEPLLQVEDWITMPDWFKHATGGEGIPCGHFTQIIGESDSGKSSAAMEAMISCQKDGGLVFLLDSEHKFSMERYALMGGSPESVIVMQADSLEDSWDALKTILDSVRDERDAGFNGKVLVFWDSLAASTPKKIQDEDDAGSAHVALEAKINNKSIRKYRAALKELNVALLAVNHSYMTMPAPGRPSKEVVKGGEELFFLSTLIIKTRKGAKIERGVQGQTQKIGRVTKFEVLKGHFHGRTINSDVYVVDKGILADKEALDEYKKTLRGVF